MRQGTRIVIYMLIAITALLVGLMQPVEAQDALSIKVVDTSAQKKPKPGKPPVQSVPEPSASLCLGMTLVALAGYGWLSRKKSQVQH